MVKPIKVTCPICTQEVNKIDFRTHIIDYHGEMLCQFYLSGLDFCDMNLALGVDWSRSVWLRSIRDYTNEAALRSRTNDQRKSKISKSVRAFYSIPENRPAPKPRPLKVPTPLPNSSPRVRTLEKANPYLFYSYDYIVCPYCDRKSVVLNSQHLRSHGKILGDVIEEFGEDYLTCTIKFSRNKSETGLRVFNLSGESMRRLGRSNPHTMPCGETVTMRSTWEVIVAKLLEELSISYQYEQLHIPYRYEDKDRIYIPDFLLSSMNLILEVKPVKFINSLSEAKREATESLGYRFQYVTRKSLNKESLELLLSSD